MRYTLTVALVFAVITTAPSVAYSKPKDTPGFAKVVSESRSAVPQHDGGRAAVQVRVYDAGIVPAASHAAALRAAAGVLAAAGIDVLWVPCGDYVAAACDAPLAPAELSVRLVRLPAAVSAQGRLQLGYSLVDTHALDGKLATVFVDRVEWLAGQANADCATLVGLATAHEIGHLLLGTNAHARTGLMRALWSRNDIQHADISQWRFSTTEGSAMRASLAQRNGLKSSKRDSAGCSRSRDDDPGAPTGCSRTALAALRTVAAGSDR